MDKKNRRPVVAELIEHDGKLAQYRGSRTEEHRPVEIDTIAVSNLKIDEYLEALVGEVPWQPFNASWDGEVRNRAGGKTRIIASDWTVIQVEREIPKPRDGREYTWTWDTYFRKWTKKPFGRCADCWSYHNPSYVYDEGAGKCYSPKAKRSA